METLRQKQNRFAGMAARLVLRAQQAGYDVTLGEAWRPPRRAALYDHPRANNNLHVLRLAIDLNLFREGGAIVNPLPDWWELNEDCRWGGRSAECENQESHYCLSYNGRV